MPEIGTFGLMSGDGKRSVGHRPKATAPILDSTITSFVADTKFRRDRVDSGHRMTTANRSILTKPYRVYCFACAATAPWSKSLQAEMNFVV